MDVLADCHILCDKSGEVERTMSLLVDLVAQAIAASPPDKIDLTISQSCATQRSKEEEIVVCGQRSDVSPYRIKQPEYRNPKPFKPEVQLAKGVTLGIEGMMIILKIKF